MDSFEKNSINLSLKLKYLSSLSINYRDQHEVDQLNDDIRRLKTENKKAFAERMRLEAQKNKLENLLTNNLNRRKDELVQALQEISVEDKKRQFENTTSKLLFCQPITKLRFHIVRIRIITLLIY